MGFINLGKQFLQSNKIPSNCDVVFVSDMFVEEYAGGAELTTEALIESSPLVIHRLKSSEVTMEKLQQGHQKYWIFGNYSNLDLNLIPTICANLKYSILEYDYKFCRYRSPEKHYDIERQKCDCQTGDHGKLISAFMYGAKSLWWMSERQMSKYMKMFPFLRERNSTVLSSVFNDETFAFIKTLKQKYASHQKQGWIIMGSPSWIKGTEDSVKWCTDNALSHEIVWGLSYNELLEKLAKAEGFVFLPKGGDTCPRMVIEAKLLGCKLQLNDNVEHKDEIWFNTEDSFDTEAYLYMSRDRFWNGIKADMSYQPKISGYTTTKDCIEQDYPFIECITSMLGFCDEVVIVDGGSTDGTWERLEKLAASDGRVVIHQQPRDWNHERFAVFDGAQKALARSLCTGDFCWQQDSDEVLHEDDYQKVKDLAKMMPKNIHMVSLPVVEYWGSEEKIRLDVNVWKWRLSQNNPTITHGIPKEMRVYDANGELYSKPGCDGCWYVKHDTYEMIPAMNFFTPDMEKVKQQAMIDPVARANFEQWLNTAMKNLPTVHHFSWFNIKRKIRTYKNYWSRHWQSMHNVIQADTPENNMFFDKSWSDVTDAELDQRAEELAEKMGGWVFHQKVDFSRSTPHIKCNQKPPRVMIDWIKRNS